MAYRDRNPLPFEEKPKTDQSDHPVVPADEEIYSEESVEEENPFDDYDEEDEVDDDDGDCEDCPFCRIKKGN